MDPVDTVTWCLMAPPRVAVLVCRWVTRIFKLYWWTIPFAILYSLVFFLVVGRPDMMLIRCLGDDIWNKFYLWHPEDQERFRILSVLVSVTACLCSLSLTIKVIVGVMHMIPLVQTGWTIQDCIPESYREDSPYFVTATPPSQFAVWIGSGLNAFLAGSGYRYKRFLVSPTHVVNAGGDGKPITIRYARNGKKDYSVVVNIQPDDWKEILPDVSYYQIPDHSPLEQIPQAKITPVEGKFLVTVAMSVARAGELNASMGPVSRIDPFGVLQYEGSTRSGFSGSVYSYSGKVVGMHIGGGVQNVGYAASYIAARLYTQESSELEALRRSLKFAKGDELDAMKVNPDEWQVHLNGRYYVLDDEDFYAMQSEFQDLVDIRAAKRRGHKLKYEPENAPKVAEQEDAYLRDYDQSMELVLKNEKRSPDGKTSHGEPVTIPAKQSQNLDLSLMLSKLEQTLAGQNELQKQFLMLSKSTMQTESRLLQVENQLKQNSTMPKECTPLPTPSSTQRPISRLQSRKCGVCKSVFEGETVSKASSLLMAHMATDHPKAHQKILANMKKISGTTDSTLSSTSSSQPSTSRDRRDSVSSNVSQQSETPSDGTESDVKTHPTLRRLSTLSSEDSKALLRAMELLTRQSM